MATPSIASRYAAGSLAPAPWWRVPAFQQQDRAGGVGELVLDGRDDGTERLGQRSVPHHPFEDVRLRRRLIDGRPPARVRAPSSSTTGIDRRTPTGWPNPGQREASSSTFRSTRRGRRRARRSSPNRDRASPAGTRHHRRPERIEVPGAGRGRRSTRRCPPCDWWHRRRRDETRSAPARRTLSMSSAIAAVSCRSSAKTQLSPPGARTSTSGAEVAGPRTSRITSTGVSGRCDERWARPARQASAPASLANAPICSNASSGRRRRCRPPRRRARSRSTLQRGRVRPDATIARSRSADERS
jgi:hypothetical protein